MVYGSGWDIFADHAEPSVVGMLKVSSMYQPSMSGPWLVSRTSAMKAPGHLANVYPQVIVPNRLPALGLGGETAARYVRLAVGA